MTTSKPKFHRETVWPFALAVTITLCSGFPASVPSDVGWLEFDKLGHFAAYGALATAIARISRVARWPALGLWWGLVLASAYGMGDEFRQTLTHGIRSPDWHDWVADTIGAVVAVALYSRWTWYRKLMETALWQKRPKPVADQTPEKERP
ncbi:MAG TPA: VanZ family protein [Lacunisphaera sp.]|nr:VanZ family protein [Lacunisphaera sp.]